jgi:hypothetical protein
MPFGADRLVFWPGDIDTLTALKWRGVLPTEGSLVPATTIRAIAGVQLSPPARPSSSRGINHDLVSRMDQADLGRATSKAVSYGQQTFGRNPTI